MTPLRFAVVSSEASTREALGRFCAKLREVTALEVEPVLLGAYSELLEGALEGGFELTWAPPLVAIDLEDAGVGHAAVVVHRSARAGYYSALFVRADSRVTKVEELDRARVAWVSPESASGYFVPRWHLRSMGVGLAQAFSDERHYGSHEAVTRAVLDGSADVGATHVALDPLTGKLSSAPWLALGQPTSVRVILLVGPIPGDVIVIHVSVDAAVRRQLVAALVAMREDEASRGLFEASQFDPVPDGHLDLLRRLSRYSETRA